MIVWILVAIMLIKVIHTCFLYRERETHTERERDREREKFGLYIWGVYG
jgi:hypothetical protein